MRRRWPYATAASLLLVAFVLWSLLLWFFYGLGTCGEDSDLTAEEWTRMCGSEVGTYDGTIFRDLAWATGVALAVGLVLSVVAVRRRSWPMTYAVLAWFVAAGTYATTFG